MYNAHCNNAEYRVVVQNTFVNVVDPSAAGMKSSLRSVQSDSFLCGQGMQMSSLIGFMDEASEPDDTPKRSQGFIPSLPKPSLPSTTWPDSGAEGSSTGETPCGVEEDDVASECPASRASAQGPGSAQLEAGSGGDDDDVRLMAAENERLTRQNLELLETVRKMQECLKETWPKPADSGFVPHAGQVCSYNALWLPAELLCGEQTWVPHTKYAEALPANGPAAQQCGTGEPAPACDGSDTSSCTTVMLRNLPNNYTRAMFIELLESEGFGRTYNFLYLPIDFKTQSALGYAFLDFAEPSVVKRFWSVFEGFSNWSVPSRKVCFVGWCEPNQGIQAHIERYRNSPVMHDSVPDEYKPMLLEHGERVPFPLPTKAIRAPRARDCRREYSRYR